MLGNVFINLTCFFILLPSATAAESTAKSPTKVVAPKPKCGASWSKRLRMGHNQSLSDGVSDARTSQIYHLIRRTRRDLNPGTPGMTFHHHSFSHLGPPGQDHSIPKRQYQPSLVAPGSDLVSEHSYSRPPASIRRVSSYPKPSLGFISTPLRRRPNVGRRPITTRATPTRVEVYITKPAALPTRLKSTTSPLLKNVTLPSSRINMTAFTPQSSFLDQLVTKKKKTTTIARDLKTSPGSQASVSSQSSSSWQRKGEALNSKETSPSTAVAALRNRKNKLIAQLWSFLPSNGEKSPTDSTGNWTDLMEEPNSFNLPSTTSSLEEFSTSTEASEIPNRTRLSEGKGDKSSSVQVAEEQVDRLRTIISVIHPTPYLSIPQPPSSNFPSQEISPLRQEDMTKISVFSQFVNKSGLVNSLHPSSSSTYILPSPVQIQASSSNSLTVPQSPFFFAATSLSTYLSGPSPSFSTNTFTPVPFSAALWLSETPQLSFLSLSSSLQIEVEATAVDTSLLPSFVFSVSPPESYLLPSAEKISTDISKVLTKHSYPSETEQSYQTQSDFLVLASRLDSDDSEQVAMDNLSRGLGPGLSSQSVGQIPHRSGLEGLGHTYSGESRLMPDPSLSDFAIGFSKNTLAQPQKNFHKNLEFFSASLASSLLSSSFSTLSPRLHDNPSLTVSAETPATEGMIGNPTLLAQTAVTGSQNRLSFTRDPLSPENTNSLVSEPPAGHEEAFYQLVSPSLHQSASLPTNFHRNAGVQAPTTKPQLCWGLDYPQQTHSSAHTRAREFKDSQHARGLPSLSATPLLPFIAYMYPAVPPAVTVSLFSSFISPSSPPLLPHRATSLPAIVTVTDSEIAFLSHTVAPLHKHLLTPTQPVLQTTRPVERFISLSVKQSFILTERELDSGSLRPSVSKDAEVSSRLAAGTSWLESAFDPADVVPKMHPVDVLLVGLNSSPILSNKTSSVMQEPVTDSVLVPSNPPSSSGLDTSSSMAASRSNTSFSISAPNQGFVSELEHLTISGNGIQTGNTVGLKNLSQIKPSLGIALENLLSQDNIGSNNTGRIDVSQHNATRSSNGDIPANSPSLTSDQNHNVDQSSGSPENLNYKDVSPPPPVVRTTKSSSPAALFKALSLSAYSLKQATLRPGPTVDSAAGPTLPCQCKPGFDFTCVCSASSGNRMSNSNNEP